MLIRHYIFTAGLITNQGQYKKPKKKKKKDKEKEKEKQISVKQTDYFAESRMENNSF